MARFTALRLSIVLSLAALLTVQAASSEVERLAMLARVWATVRYLHPLLLQKEIDWDGALVRAIPAVRAATTDDEFARAVGSMLNALGDPATRVIQTKPSAQPVPDMPRTADRRYADHRRSARQVKGDGLVARWVP
jgi:hypothetical protein